MTYSTQGGERYKSDAYSGTTIFLGEIDVRTNARLMTNRISDRVPVCGGCISFSVPKSIAAIFKSTA
jgi:hypothetical protein